MKAEVGKNMVDEVELGSLVRRKAEVLMLHGGECTGNGL